MKKWLVTLVLLGGTAASAFAEGFSLMAGSFVPADGDLKNATGSSWLAFGAEYIFYKLPMGEVGLELGWMSKSGTSGGTKTTVDIVPVSVNYHFKSGAFTEFGAGAGLYSVKSKSGATSKSESAFGGHIFLRQSFANLFMETRYQFANADAGTNLDNQSGVLIFFGITL